MSAKKQSKRQKAIRRRRQFFCLVSIVLIVAVALVCFAVNLISDALNKNEEIGGKTSEKSSISSNSSAQKDKGKKPAEKDDEEEPTKKDEEKEPSKKDTYNPDNTQNVTLDGVELDANFRRVLLINGKNPLPDDYDANIRKDLVTIDAKFRNNNNVTDIHKEVYPYITAMVAAANKDGVNLKVWSPFRSYATQNILFQNQVNRVGGDEAKAATVVARPGTSEHNTGLCADFNMASDRFESTDMFKWMQENAEDYGFILRYPKDKQHITGVIYESWHWRFVGINTAKEMNKLGLTLEEYVEYKGIDWSTELPQ